MQLNPLDYTYVKNYKNVYDKIKYWMHWFGVEWKWRRWINKYLLKKKLWNTF